MMISYIVQGFIGPGNLLHNDILPCTHDERVNGSDPQCRIPALYLLDLQSTITMLNSQ